VLSFSLHRRTATSTSLDVAEAICNARALADELVGLSDVDLRYHAGLARKQSDLSSVHALAFAIEAIRRTLLITVYDRQLEAAMVLADGQLAEMQTGEGKTLTGAIAAIIHAMQSRHVHVATTNEYLARRDHELLSPVFESLGFTTGLSTADQGVTEKQVAYSSDVVFATGYQLGFDYLRDQLTLASRPGYRLGQRLLQQLQGSESSKDGLCQREHDVAIIDEVDSVLIDEAMTPLVLSGALHRDHTNAENDASISPFRIARECILSLREGVDFHINSLDRSIQLTSSGTQQAMDLLLLQATPLNLDAPWPQYIQSALRAEYLLRRDVDYVVRANEVQIVDASTGRIVPDRQWRGGLHQAVETKERVTHTQPRQTLARMSRQRYFARYQTLSGMTGTASGHDREWQQVYGLSVKSIATRLPSQRTEYPTLYAANVEQKLTAIIDDVLRCTQAGQPVLIGTRTIEQTRLVASSLLHARINHRMLNGVQDETEASLIATAGRAGNVTVATNMAGRGTDIVLDQAAMSAGGLYVIGFERNLSPRIDRQLLGRAARQGQPGGGRFFVAPEDELITRYDASLGKALTRLHTPTSNPSWDRRVTNLQRRSERERYELRQQTAKQEEWLNELRHYVA
jgi:preprotein translocase subunit SecA